MIHEIKPRVFHNEFNNNKAKLDDLFLFTKSNVLVKEDKDKLWYPTFADFYSSHPTLMEKAQFLLLLIA